MVAGIDYWFDSDHNFGDFIIIDERLTKRLGGKQLVMPPDFASVNRIVRMMEMKIPSVRFPQWHYCRMRKYGKGGLSGR
jgi:hypothetical protein